MYRRRANDGSSAGGSGSFRPLAAPSAPSPFPSAASASSLPPITISLSTASASSRLTLPGRFKKESFSQASRVAAEPTATPKPSTERRHVESAPRPAARSVAFLALRSAQREAMESPSPQTSRMH